MQSLFKQKRDVSEYDNKVIMQIYEELKIVSNEFSTLSKRIAAIEYEQGLLRNKVLRKLQSHPLTRTSTAARRKRYGGSAATEYEDDGDDFDDMDED